MKTVLIKSLKGLGDTFFQRPYIKKLTEDHQVYINSPWPELLSDLPNIQFIRPDVDDLHTQRKNVHRQEDARWADPLEKYDLEIAFSYSLPELRQHGNIFKAFENAVGFSLDDLNLDMPLFDTPVDLPTERPVAVVRPVTVRREWMNVARNPEPKYVQRAINRLQQTHHIISVADMKRGIEWTDSPLTGVHQKFDQGELNVTQLIGLVQRADIVVGGVGWIVPVCMGVGTRQFTIFGGCGGLNHPKLFYDERYDKSLIGYAVPDNMCMCNRRQHVCRDKTISNFDQIFEDFL